MVPEWFSVIELPLSLQQFHRLPQNPAYKYEYYNGRAVLSPRPWTLGAVLNLPSYSAGSLPTDGRLVIRELQETDWRELPSLFAAALRWVQPFASLTDDDRLAAAEDCIGETHNGGEGPLVGEACMAALRDETLIGAALVTHPADNTIDDSPALPHLTWIFVEPRHARKGVGTALLDAVVPALQRLGHQTLTSAFLLGNESSMLWHWQSGFKLRDDPWSIRVFRRRSGL